MGSLKSIELSIPDQKASFLALIDASSSFPLLKLAWKKIDLNKFEKRKSVLTLQF